MNKDAMIPEDQNNWLHEVVRSWEGDQIRLEELATGTVRLCIEDRCWAAAPGQVDVASLAHCLTQMGIVKEREQ